MDEIVGVIFGLIVLIIFFGIAGLACFGLYLLVRKVMGGSVEGEIKKTAFIANFFSDSLFYRIVFGLVLILVSIIPLGFVSELVSERGNLYQSVSVRMTDEWSGAQKISGPFLTIPYEYTDYVLDRIENKVTGEVKSEKRPINVLAYLTILPEKLDISTSLQTEELNRGIYRVPIYTSNSSMKGSFKWPDISVLDHQPEKYLWSKAIVSFMVAETKGIQGGTALKWNGEEVALSPGLGLSGTEITDQGVHARISIDESIQMTSKNFEFILSLRGSAAFSYAPTGKESSVKLDANWGDPSFQGKLLPVSREITENNFNATWNITHLSRPYEQLESLNPSGQANFLSQLKDFSLGVNLIDTINLYTLLDRTTKYGIMFIGLTFFSIFIIEFASGARLHWLQHLIIGAALSMFYLCVLAFSEHIEFGYAYAIGTAIITGIIGAYAWVAIGNAIYGIALGGVMLALYTTLYSILQMEDYALLIGTILLLVFLVLGMYVTRNMGKRANGGNV